MKLFIDAFYIILYRPLFNFLVLLYKYIPGQDFGFSVIILTILIKILLYPLGMRAIKSQKALSELQPKIKKIQEKYKNDKQKQTFEILALYKKAKINPFSGLLLVLIQFPILIALYRVFRYGLQPEQMSHLYSFVSVSLPINPQFLGIIDLTKPFWLFAVLAGFLQFVATKMLMPKEKKNQKKKSEISELFQKQMQYFLPLFTVIILLKLPSVLGLYWITTTVFSIVQQYLVLKKKNKYAGD